MSNSSSVSRHRNVCAENTFDGIIAMSVPPIIYCKRDDQVDMIIKSSFRHMNHKNIQ